MAENSSKIDDYREMMDTFSFKFLKLDQTFALTKSKCI